ncbi:MAG: hypothetical protein WC788_06620 [Candidatus Paceibacterota bacterium]|jgi:hypothetical protein
MAGNNYLKNNVVLEEKLLSLIPDKFREVFESKLKNVPSYWQTISEMRAIIIFNNKLGISVIEIDKKTVSKKDVDFACELNGGTIYVEVKGFRPEEYEKARRGGVLSGDDDEIKIDRALTRARNKFLDNAHNIVVLADEDTMRPPLFMSPILEMQNTPEMYLNLCENSKVSSLMILGGMYEEQMFDYKIWHNPNPQKYLPEAILSLFLQMRSNNF